VRLRNKKAWASLLATIYGSEYHRKNMKSEKMTMAKQRRSSRSGALMASAWYEKKTSKQA